MSRHGCVRSSASTVGLQRKGPALNRALSVLWTVSRSVNSKARGVTHMCARDMTACTQNLLMGGSHDVVLGVVGVAGLAAVVAGSGVVGQRAHRKAHRRYHCDQDCEYPSAHTFLASSALGVTCDHTERSPLGYGTNTAAVRRNFVRDEIRCSRRCSRVRPDLPTVFPGGSTCNSKVTCCCLTRPGPG